MTLNSVAPGSPAAIPAAITKAVRIGPPRRADKKVIAQ